MATISHDHHAGKEPALVMIHGWSCSRQEWHAQYQHFRGRQELLVPDLPGHGETPADTRLNCSMPAFARDTLAIMDEALDARSAILLGHSMGGAIALEAAALAPDRIRGVILADTFLINYGALPREAIDKLYRPFAEDFRQAVSKLVDNSAGPNADETLRQSLKKRMGSSDPAWAVKVWRQLLEWDPSSAMRQLTCPVHAINSPLIPKETRERLAPWISATIIPDTGHFLHMEAPDAFNTALEHTLARIMV